MHSLSLYCAHSVTHACMYIRMCVLVLLSTAAVGLGEEGRAVEVTFEPGGPEEKEFAVSVEEGDLVRYLPLDLVNPDCEPQARTNEDGDYIIREC